MKADLRFVAAAVLTWSLVGCRESPPSGTIPVKLLVRGAESGCCEFTIESALRRLKEVERVVMKEGGGRTFAVVELKEGASLELSRVQGALSAAARSVNEVRPIGLDYRVDSDLLAFTESACLKVRPPSESVREEIERALYAYDGFKSVDVQ